MCRIVSEIRNAAIALAANVLRSYKKTGSVPETAQENGITEEEVIFILRKFQILPM